MIYLVMTAVSETALLGGFFLTVGAGGTMLIDAPDAIASSGHVSLIGVVLLIGFGVKAGLVPVLVWLPLAHPAAPPVASTLPACRGQRIYTRLGPADPWPVGCFLAGGARVAAG